MDRAICQNVKHLSGKLEESLQHGATNGFKISTDRRLQRVRVSAAAPMG